jgi:hypothetical protein
LFSQKEKIENFTLKILTISAQRIEDGPLQPVRNYQNAVKVSAMKLFAHLGHIWPKSL